MHMIAIHHSSGIYEAHLPISNDYYIEFLPNQVRVIDVTSDEPNMFLSKTYDDISVLKKYSMIEYYVDHALILSKPFNSECVTLGKTNPATYHFPFYKGEKVFCILQIGADE